MQGCLNIYSRMPEKHIKPGLKIPDQLRLRHLSAAEGCFHRIGKLRIIQFCQSVIMKKILDGKGAMFSLGATPF